jgi:hypothetical protein
MLPMLPHARAPHAHATSPLTCANVTLTLYVSLKQYLYFSGSTRTSWALPLSPMERIICSDGEPSPA